MVVQCPLVADDASFDAALGDLAEVLDHGCHEVRASGPGTHRHIDEEPQITGRRRVAGLETETELEVFETIPVWRFAKFG
jgi:hypothetical protein